jgi:hypothetical protein
LPWPHAERCAPPPTTRPLRSVLSGNQSFRRIDATPAAPARPLLLILSACTGTTDGSQPGGPVTPSSIPIDIGPSAQVAGNTMPTGIVVDGKELVLFFWTAAKEPVFAQAVRDTATGIVSEGVGMCRGGTGSDSPPPFLGMQQCVATDGTLIEYGACSRPPGSAPGWASRRAADLHAAKRVRRGSGYEQAKA